MGSQQQDQKQSSTTTPWAPQMNYLQGAFADTQNAENQAKGNNSAFAPSDFTAQWGPDQYSAFRNMLSYGNSSPTAQNEAAIGGNLAGAGYGGTQGALTTLNGFNPNATNNTGAVTQAAGQMADNPYISGMTQAAMRDANQQAQDVTLPGIQRDAAGSGNINSNRTAIANGVVQRGLAQQAGDISAQLHGNAYNTGLQTAEGMYSGNNAQTIGAASAAGGIGNQAAAEGLSGLSSSVNDQGNLYKTAADGGAGELQGNQANLDNQMQRWQFGQQSPFSPVQNAYNIWGANNWGGTTNSTGSTTTTPSMFQTIAGLMGAGGSIASGVGKSGLGWMPFA